MMKVDTSVPRTANMTIDTMLWKKSFLVRTVFAAERERTESRANEIMEPSKKQTDYGITGMHAGGKGQSQAS